MLTQSSIALTFDFDAMAVWLENGDDVSPNTLQRGEYCARVGVPRVLEFLERERLPATFFIPGHTADSFPEATQAIVNAGHEIGHHTYAHVEPRALSAEDEAKDLDRGLEALARFGVRPIGFRSGGHSQHTLALLESRGFLYDSSYKGDDFTPYRPRVGDVVGQQTPLKRGREARLWELPTQYEFDDWVHFSFNFSPYRNGTSAPSKVLEIWTTQLDWMRKHVPGGLLNVLMHPQVIGRAHCMHMLEQFVAHAKSTGVEFTRLDHVARQLEAEHGTGR